MLKFVTADWYHQFFFPLPFFVCVCILFFVHHNHFPEWCTNNFIFFFSFAIARHFHCDFAMANDENVTLSLFLSSPPGFFFLWVWILFVYKRSAIFNLKNDLKSLKRTERKCTAQKKKRKRLSKTTEKGKFVPRDNKWNSVKVLMSIHSFSLISFLCVSFFFWSFAADFLRDMNIAWVWLFFFRSFPESVQSFSLYRPHSFSQAHSPTRERTIDKKIYILRKKEMCNWVLFEDSWP